MDARLWLANTLTYLNFFDHSRHTLKQESYCTRLAQISSLMLHSGLPLTLLFFLLRWKINSFYHWNRLLVNLIWTLACNKCIYETFTVLFIYVFIFVMGFLRPSGPEINCTRTKDFSLNKLFSSRATASAWLLHLGLQVLL